MLNQTKTQKDIVEAEKSKDQAYDSEIVTIPGIKELHNKTTSEIAEVLAVVLKSRANIKSITYVLGEHVKVSY